MGDRGNIVMQEAAGKRVWFYTHWRGSEIQEVVQHALARRQRWEDHAYLARIVFCTLIGGDVASETGFGISTGQCDNEHPILVVNTESQSVYFEKEDGTRVTPLWEKSFEEVVNPTFAWPEAPEE